MRSELAPRERILETAYRLFYTQGYNQTGINQIIEESKVARASLYQHFGSKEILGLEYIEKVREDWFLAFENYLQANQNSANKILLAFDFLSKNMIANEYRGCRFLNLLTEIESTSKDIQDQIIEHKTKLRAVFATFVQEYKKENNINLFLTDFEDTIYLLFEGAITESKVFQQVWPIEAARKTVEALLQLKK